MTSKALVKANPNPDKLTCKSRKGSRFYKVPKIKYSRLERFDLTILDEHMKPILVGGRFAPLITKKQAIRHIQLLPQGKYCIEIQESVTEKFFENFHKPLTKATLISKIKNL